MGINADYIGRDYPPFGPYVVSREKVREFAEATGNLHPLHLDTAASAAAGFPDVVAPTTFSVIIAQQAEAQLISDPEAGIDFTRVVHADESFTLHQPLVAGMEVMTVLHVDNVVERAGLSLVTTRCELFADDKLIAEVTSTLAVRGESA